MNKKIFISHSSEDKAFARRLKRAFEAYPIDVWLDEKNLNIGDSLSKVFTEEIRSSTHFMLLISKASNQSKWVKKELNTALNENITILPLLIEECEIDVRLKDIKYLDFINNDDFIYPFNELLRTLELIDEDITKPMITNIRFHDKDPDIYPDAPSYKVFKRSIFLRYIYVSWEPKYFHTGVKFGRTWFRDYEKIKNLVRTDKWDELWIRKGKRVSTFIYSHFGHKKGEYAVRFSIEDEFVATGTFRVV